MLKKSKKITAVAIATLMTVLSVTSCSDDASVSNSSGDGEVVKLTALIVKHPLTKDLNEMEWLNEVAAANNVEIEWQQITADWDQKKAPMLASGEIPDLLFNAVNDADYATYNGLFEDLTPWIESNGANIQTMFDEKPETKTLATSANGAIYALPKYQRFWPETICTMFINKQWLDNLGLQVPKTWDELHTVLLAFKAEDANGNGDLTDEIPMDFTGRNEYSPMTFLGSLGMQLTATGSDGYFAEDGQVKNYYNDERYKELMIYLNKLYADGLINQEVFTADYSTFQATSRGVNGVSKVGFTFGWESTDRFGLDLADEYISIPPLKVDANSDIEPRWLNSYYFLNMDGNRVSMSASSKHKAEAMNFINALYEPEVSIQVLWGGITDGSVEKNADGSYTVLPPLDTTIDPGSWKWQETFADIGPIYLSDDMEVTLGTDMQAVLGEKSVYTDALSKVNRAEDELLMSFLKFKTEDMNVLELNRVSFINIATQYWADFMINGNVESRWDDYVNQLEQSGINKNSEIIQPYYEEYLKTVK